MSRGTRFALTVWISTVAFVASYEATAYTVARLRSRPPRPPKVWCVVIGDDPVVQAAHRPHVSGSGPWRISLRGRTVFTSESVVRYQAEGSCEEPGE